MNQRPAKYALGAAIFVGSLTMWIGIPFASLWLVSKASDDALGMMLLVLAFCPLLMFLFGFVLAALNGAYLRASGTEPAPAARRTRSAWLKSLSAERGQAHPWPVLDVSMTVSVALAFVLLVVFFLFFADSYMPASPTP
jgi:hypothetical protein